MSEEENKLIAEISRAARVKAFVEDELFQQAFNQIEKQYLEEWMDSPARDTEGREKLWWALKILKKVRSDIEKHVETGGLAKTQLERLREGIKNFF